MAFSNLFIIWICNVNLAFSGAQKEFTVTDKYVKKVTLDNWGKPCIWLSNHNPLETPNMPHWQKQYLEANCIFVNLEHRLYTPEPIIPEMFREPVQVVSRENSQRDRGEGGSNLVTINENTVYLEDLYPNGIVTI